MLGNSKSPENVEVRLFNDILRSIGTHQRSEIQEILGKIDKELDDTTLEISTLKTRILSLNAQREWLQKQKSVISSLLSPIHRLPNELLLRAFRFACHQNNLEVKIVDAFSVAAVCHRWRELAISCPALWSNFEVWIPSGDPESEDESNVEHVQKRLDIFLSRSKAHPLTVTITASVPHEEISPGHPLLLKIVQSSPRWKHLVLCIWDINVVSDGFNCLWNATLTALETITFQLDDSEQPSGYIWIPPSSNSLCAISTNSCLSDLTTIVPSPSLGGITALTFSPDSSHLLEPLKFFPNLQHLGLRHHNFLELNDPNLDMLPCSVPITSLDIELCSPARSSTSDDMLGMVMDLLTASSLSALTLTGDRSWLFDRNQNKSGFFTHIHAFIDRSGCSLTVLVLKNLSISDRCAVDLLKRLGTLVELTLEDPKVSGPAKKAISYPISKALIESFHSYRSSPFTQSFSPIVPRLRSLILVIQSDSKFPSQAFIDTISSRWIPDRLGSERIGVSCLRSVELHLPELIVQREYLPLTDFERCGMRVVVKGK